MPRSPVSMFWSSQPGQIRSNFLSKWRQQRELSSYVGQFHPEIGNIYNTLLNQTTASIQCNFISQVVDYWGRDPKKPAIYCIDQDTENREAITYQQIVRHSHQVAYHFKKMGFSKGDSVALMLGQNPVWWYSLAGLMRAGIAAIPCSRLLTPNDLAYRVNDLKIKGIITIPELQENIDVIRDQCPSLIGTMTTGRATDNWYSMNDIFEDEHVVLQSSDTTTHDPCLYLYTSGTTGQPKAVQHNADYPFFHWPTGRRWLQATPDDLVYNASDTGWGFTVWITTAVWSMGAKLLITPTTQKFNAKRMLSTLEDESVSIFCAAPTVLRRLVAEHHFDDYRLPKLKRIVTVGEALDETVIKQFKARGVEIAVGFGQAETPLLMGRVDDQPHVSGTMGKSIDPYKVTILDDELQPLPPGNTGQIAVDLVEGKRSGIMRGYANAPEKTKKAFSPDQHYYLTGDWATLRQDGLFAYAGRRDDLIKSRGYRIGPDEVEKAGMSHPAVAKIAVIGVRTSLESAEITVKAFILLKPHYTESPELIESIQDHIKHETGPYKYPRLVECLSLHEWEQYETTSGKIRRAGLREREEASLVQKASEVDSTSYNPG